MMFGMNNELLPLTVREMERKAGLEFVNPKSLLFLTGAPLSGKSTIAPMISSSIEGCGQQSMDIVRLMAQELERLKPEPERNPFVQFGSCDSYSLIGNGSYSPESLVAGFNSYSEAVFSVLKIILPKLELQGVQNLLFEGVQLTPRQVEPYLVEGSKLIVVVSDSTRLEANRNKMFGNDEQMTKRYSTEKLLLIQDEILAQATKLAPENLIIINNTGSIGDSASAVINNLIRLNTLRPKL